MPYTLPYFCFVAVLIGLLNFVVIRAQVNRVVKQKPELLNIARKVTTAYLVFLTLPFLLLGIIQLLSGYDDLFIFSNDLTNPFVLAAYFVLIMSWMALAFLIYFRGGANAMIQVGAVRGNELMLKIYIGLMLLGGGMGLIFIRSLAQSALGMR